MQRNYSLFDDEDHPEEAGINPLSQEESNQPAQFSTEAVGRPGAADGVRANDSESIRATELALNFDVELQETSLSVATETIFENPAREDTERLTVHLPVTLIDRIRGAVFETPELTLARLAAESFSARLAEMEAARGAQFKPRATRLKGGRPRRKSHERAAQ